MTDYQTLLAARRLLATVEAGRAASLSLAAAYLPLRSAALLRESFQDQGIEAATWPEAAVERRLAIERLRRAPARGSHSYDLYTTAGIDPVGALVSSQFDAVPPAFPRGFGAGRHSLPPPVTPSPLRSSALADDASIPPIRTAASLPPGQAALPHPLAPRPSLPPPRPSMDAMSAPSATLPPVRSLAPTSPPASLVAPAAAEPAAAEPASPAPTAAEPASPAPAAAEPASPAADPAEPASPAPAAAEPASPASPASAMAAPDAVLPAPAVADAGPVEEEFDLSAAAPPEPVLAKASDSGVDQVRIGRGNRRLVPEGMLAGLPKDPKPEAPRATMAERLGSLARNIEASPASGSEARPATLVTDRRRDERIARRIALGQAHADAPVPTPDPEEVRRPVARRIPVEPEPTPLFTPSAEPSLAPDAAPGSSPEVVPDVVRDADAEPTGQGAAACPPAEAEAPIVADATLADAPMADVAEPHVAASDVAASDVAASDVAASDIVASDTAVGDAPSERLVPPWSDSAAPVDRTLPPPGAALRSLAASLGTAGRRGEGGEAARMSAALQSPALSAPILSPPRAPAAPVVAAVDASLLDGPYVTLETPVLREAAARPSTATIDVRPRAATSEETIALPEKEGLHEDADDHDSGDGMRVHFEVAAPARDVPLQPQPSQRLSFDDDDLTVVQRVDEDAVDTKAGAVLVDHGARRQAEQNKLGFFLETARQHVDRGEYQKAIQAFTDALDINLSHAEAYIGRGRCQMELGDYTSAMSDFRRAEDLQPKHPDPQVAMGDLYFARKEYKRAIEFYDQAVELDGAHAMARCRRGISHYYRKNYRQAFQDLQRANALDPEIPNIKKYVQMALKKMEKAE